MARCTSGASLKFTLMGRAVISGEKRTEFWLHLGEWIAPSGWVVNQHGVLSEEEGLRIILADSVPIYEAASSHGWIGLYPYETDYAGITKNKKDIYCRLSKVG